MSHYSMSMVKILMPSCCRCVRATLSPESSCHVRRCEAQLHYGVGKNKKSLHEIRLGSWCEAELEVRMRTFLTKYRNAAFSFFSISITQSYIKHTHTHTNDEGVRARRGVIPMKCFGVAPLV